MLIINRITGRGDFRHIRIGQPLLFRIADDEQFAAVEQILRIVPRCQMVLDLLERGVCGDQGRRQFLIGEMEDRFIADFPNFFCECTVQQTVRFQGIPQRIDQFAGIGQNPIRKISRRVRIFLLISSLW